MAHLLAALLALMQLLTPALQQALPQRLRSGQWLRMHVIAHDDTQEMQRLKLLVRDAVQACYAAAAPKGDSMLDNAAALLPHLSAAARQTAQDAGFHGSVCVTLQPQYFSARSLMGIPVPAGTYPALMIRLGDGQGQNWWGLLDPEASLSLALISRSEDGRILWDWSWEGLLAALFGLMAEEA